MTKPWRVNPEQSGGGHIWDMGSYALDIVAYLLGPITEAKSMWDRHRIWTELEEQLSQPPFTARSNNQREIAYVRANVEQAASRIN